MNCTLTRHHAPARWEFTCGDYSFSGRDIHELKREIRQHAPMLHMSDLVEELDRLYTAATTPESARIQPTTAVWSLEHGNQRVNIAMKDFDPKIHQFQRWTDQQIIDTTRKAVEAKKMKSQREWVPVASPFPTRRDGGGQLLYGIGLSTAYLDEIDKTFDQKYWENFKSKFPTFFVKQKSTVPWLNLPYPTRPEHAGWVKKLLNRLLRRSLGRNPFCTGCGRLERLERCSCRHCGALL